MDSFIGKDTRIDTVRSTRPNKSLRVTRDDGSHGNKSDHEAEEPVDQIDIDADLVDENSENESDAAQRATIISLKIIRDAMVVQAQSKPTPSKDIDPSYQQALSAYGTYLSNIVEPPELQKVDENGMKTPFGKLSDLIENGVDHVEKKKGQTYDQLILSLWNQMFSTNW